MTTVHIEIRRDDLRALVRLARQRRVGSFLASLAALFVDANDIEVRSLGACLEELEGLVDDADD